MDFYFFAGILTLWLISSDFKNSLYHELKQKSPRLPNTSKQILLVKQYKSISRLSRKFSQAYGHLLISYIIFQCLYYSFGLSQLLLPVSFSEKLYQIRYLLLVMANIGFGVGFSLKVFNLFGIRRMYSFAQYRILTKHFLEFFFVRCHQ